MPTKKTQQKILVVEDETFLVKIYSVKLKSEGFDVSVATDGVEAIKMTDSFKPDLILLDLVLPKMNGFEALEKIRSKPENRNIPVIVLSNLSQEEDVKRAQALGAMIYLVKADFSIQDIVSKIKETIGKKNS